MGTLTRLRLQRERRGCCWHFLLFFRFWNFCQPSHADIHFALGCMNTKPPHNRYKWCGCCSSAVLTVAHFQIPQNHNHSTNSTLFQTCSQQASTGRGSSWRRFAGGPGKQASLQSQAPHWHFAAGPFEVAAASKRLKLLWEWFPSKPPSKILAYATFMFLRSQGTLAAPYLAQRHLEAPGKCRPLNRRAFGRGGPFVFLL